jgi:coproporphyrinogen III oxidase-like Fe-S oxidoreductase
VALDEPVGAAEVAREEIFLGLRLSSGVPLERVAAFVVGSQDVRLWNDYEGWLSEGILERSGDRVRFTERGFLVSNEVLSRFV